LHIIKVKSIYRTVKLQNYKDFTGLFEWVNKFQLKRKFEWGW